MIYRHGLSKTMLRNMAADIISTHILAATSGTERAALFLSGGSTPGPIYEMLSEIDLPWKRVDVGLVDERWVDETDKGSNAALLRHTLLQNNAKVATFTPMKTAHKALQDAQACVEVSYEKIFKNNSLAVLGMGVDGHVCSWFPQSDGLEMAIDPTHKKIVQVITAIRSDVTGDYLDRMTLTLFALKQCQTLLLLITGAEKQGVLEMAIDNQRPDLPVSNLLALNNLIILHAA